MQPLVLPGLEARREHRVVAIGAVRVGIFAEGVEGAAICEIEHVDGEGLGIPFQVERGERVIYDPAAVDLTRLFC